MKDYRDEVSFQLTVIVMFETRINIFPQYSILNDIFNNVLTTLPFASLLIDKLRLFIVIKVELLFVIHLYIQSVLYKLTSSVH